MAIGPVITVGFGSFGSVNLLPTLGYTSAVGAYTLTAGHGSFTLSGQAAGLLATRAITATYGSYTLSGQTAGLSRAVTITAAVGTYTLSGQTAGLLATRIVTATYGSYTLSGQAATLQSSAAGTVTAASYPDFVGPSAEYVVMIGSPSYAATMEGTS